MPIPILKEHVVHSGVTSLGLKAIFVAYAHCRINGSNQACHTPYLCISREPATLTMYMLIWAFFLLGLRHLLVSGGPYLTGPLWRLASRSVRRASRVTLHSAQQLMVCFHADSENFYGDVGQAKVAVRRDCTASEVDRLRQLCRQVSIG